MRTTKLLQLLSFPTFYLLVLIVPFQKTFGQVTAPAPKPIADSAILKSSLEDEFFSLTQCQSELYGPMNQPSRGWQMIDHIILQRGSDSAYSFFRSALLKGNKVIQFYALIGIYKTKGESEYHNAKLTATPEKVLVQKECLMMMKPVAEATDAVLLKKF